MTVENAIMRLNDLIMEREELNKIDWQRNELRYF